MFVSSINKNTCNTVRYRLVSDMLLLLNDLLSTYLFIYLSGKECHGLINKEEMAGQSFC